MLINLLPSLLSGDMESMKFALAISLLSLPIIILALSVHEVSHGFVAYKLGDPTARNLGRLTLNPLKHLDPIGFILMLIFGFGFAKPVPINSRNFKKPKRDMALTSLAGPASNVLLAIIFAIILRIIHFIPFPVAMLQSQTWANVITFTIITLEMGVSLNLMLDIFNLIPCPPLDGSNILYAFLPTKATLFMIKYERFFYYGLLILVMLRVLPLAMGFATDRILMLLEFIFRMNFIFIL